MVNGIDLFEIIFEMILQIDPSTLVKYSTLQDQLLFLILVPHIVLLLFIVAFSRSIVRRVVGSHRGFEYLFALAAYLVVILTGWYGGFLVPILITWFYVGLIVAFIIFILSIVISPARTTVLAKMFKETGSVIGKETIGKSKRKKAIEKEIDKLESKKNSLVERMNLTTDPTAKGYLSVQIGEIEGKIAELQHELDES
jgi:hypothetical protein